MSSEGVVLLLWQLTAVADVLEAQTEYRFHAERKWRFDIAWPEKMVALEVDGGSWIGGRHTSGAGFEADCEKHSMAAALGWRVLRVTPRQIKEGKALTWLLAALQ